jgi:hypothetical protein
VLDLDLELVHEAWYGRPLGADEKSRSRSPVHHGAWCEQEMFEIDLLDDEKLFYTLRYVYMCLYVQPPRVSHDLLLAQVGASLSKGE